MRAGTVALPSPLTQSLGGCQQILMGLFTEELKMNDDVDLYNGMPKIDQKTVKVVNYIFERLAGIIPSMDYSASNQVGLDSRKREYTYRLMEENISNMASINKAITKISKAGLTFLPSPAEFVKYCQLSPEDLGAPHVEDAYSEAALHAHPQSWTKKWSHVAVHHAYKQIGSNNFLNVCSSKAADKLFNKFQAYYLQSCLDYAAGKIMDQLPSPNQQDNRTPIYSNEENWKPGNILEQYKNVSSAEECFAICDNLLGKGDRKLRKLVGELEKKYNDQYGMG